MPDGVTPPRPHRRQDRRVRFPAGCGRERNAPHRSGGFQPPTCGAAFGHGSRSLRSWTAAGSRRYGLSHLALACAAAASLTGCVANGPFATRRAVIERHPLGEKQAVITVSGRLPPPPREVHRFRLNHGAPRRHAPAREAFPWWPGVRDAALAAAGRAAAEAGDVIDGAGDLAPSAAAGVCPERRLRPAAVAPPPACGL